MFAVVATPAQSQMLSLDGIWGNEAGCRFARDGNYDNDEMRVLRADGIESYAMGCDWLQVLTAKNGTQVATGLCGHEGEEYRTVETFIIDRVVSDEGSEKQRVRISTNSGDDWGEVSKCQ